MMNGILRTAILIPLLFANFSAEAQKDPALRNAKAGNQAYEQKAYKKALEHYEKAAKAGMKDQKLCFNKGDALFQLEKYAEAAKDFKRIAQARTSERLRAKAYHNLGNSQLKAGKIDKSIKAYKNALRIDPADEDTRYNLALAKKLKRKKQKQKKQQQNKKNKEQEQKKNKKKGKNEQKKSGGDKKKQQQKGSQQEKQKGKKEQQKAKQGKDKQGERKKRRMSPQEVERLLRAMEESEKKVQQKVLRKRRKKKGQEKDVEKDW